MHSTPRFHRLAAISALAIGLLGAGCTTTPSAGPVSSVAVQDDAMRAASPRLGLSISVTPSQVRTGEAVTLQVDAPTGGYLYVFQVSTDGKSLSLSFPNAFDGANYLPPGAKLQLPRSNWRLTTRGPAGLGYFYAVLTPNALDLLAVKGLEATGRLQFAGEYGMAMATLREVAP